VTSVERGSSRSRVWLFAQFAPLAMLVLFILACGCGDLVGLSGKPTAELFLRGFSATGTSSPNNTNSPLPFQPLSGIHPTALDSQTGTLTVPTIFAVFSLANGVTARLDRIIVRYTEVTGEPIVDLSVTPPVSLGSQFDSVIELRLLMEAPPITSVPAGLAEPTGNINNIFVPLDLFQRAITNFAYRGANSREFRVTITGQGEDIFGHPFSVQGSLLIEQVIGPLIQN
jgi:hypothetical protein